MFCVPCWVPCCPKAPPKTDPGLTKSEKLYIRHGQQTSFGKCWECHEILAPQNTKNMDSVREWRQSPHSCKSADQWQNTSANCQHLDVPGCLFATVGLAGPVFRSPALTSATAGQPSPSPAGSGMASQASIRLSGHQNAKSLCQFRLILVLTCRLKSTE